MHTHPFLHIPWRVLVGTVGTVVVLAGIVMMVLPGPGIASVLLGLLILSTEFRWAHRLLRPARVWARRSERWAIKVKDQYLERRRERRAAKAARRGLASGPASPPPSSSSQNSPSPDPSPPGSPSSGPSSANVPPPDTPTE